MQSRLFWKTVPNVLNWTVCVSTLLLVVKILWLNRIPEPVAGMRTMGIVVEGILGSAIASYVFYLLTIHLKDVADKGNIYPFVLHSCRNVVGDRNALLGEIAKAVERPLSVEQLTAEELKEALLPIAFEDNTTAVTMDGVPANWYDYHSYIRKRSHEHIETALVQATFLESGLVSLLIKIDECAYFRVAESFVHWTRSPGGTSMMHTISYSIFEYSQLCEELSKLIDKLSIWEQSPERE